jgi:AbrB family looped-hinge helix DNA binding protein
MSKERVCLDEEPMSVKESARVTSKGQLTIPKPIRDRLGIDEGTAVTFEIHDDGTVTLTPQKNSWELLDEIRDAPRETDRSVAELMAESKRAWSGHE